MEENSTTNKLIQYKLKQKKPIAVKLSVFILNKLNYLSVFTDCFAYPFSGSIASVLLNISIAFTLSVLA
jgi:hypothetical protein